MTQDMYEGSTVDSFPQFLRLPPELRLMIWKYTWPQARVIEAGLEYPDGGSDDFDDNSDNSYNGDSEDGEEYIVLRLAGRLSTFLACQEQLTTKIAEHGPFEKCLDPVALWVCQESRMITMTQYIAMQHPVLETCSFYFNPSRDVLWFSMDVIGEIEFLPQMQLYGKQLDNIKIAFVEELWWSEKSPEEYSSAFLDFLGGLKTVLLLLDRDNCTEADNREYAEELRITHQKLLSCREWTIMYMDLEGKFY